MSNTDHITMGDQCILKINLLFFQSTICTESSLIRNMMTDMCCYCNFKFVTGHNYAQTNTNNVNTTCALLQTTGGKDEPNIVLCGNRNGEVILQILHVGFDIFVLFCEA